MASWTIGTVRRLIVSPKRRFAKSATDGVCTSTSAKVSPLVLPAKLRWNICNTIAQSVSSTERAVSFSKRARMGRKWCAEYVHQSCGILTASSAKLRRHRRTSLQQSGRKKPARGVGAGPVSNAIAVGRSMLTRRHLQKARISVATVTTSNERVSAAFAIRSFLWLPSPKHSYTILRGTQFSGVSTARHALAVER